LTTDLVNECALAFTQAGEPMTQGGGEIVTRFIERAHAEGARSRDEDVRRAHTNGYLAGMANATARADADSINAWIESASPSDLGVVLSLATAALAALVGDAHAGLNDVRRRVERVRAGDEDGEG
jgi:hypothetical protein